MPASDQPDDAPIVRQLLAETESALRRNAFPDDQISAALANIRKTLIETAQKTPLPTEGGPKVIHGDRFYALKDMGGQVIESGVKLAIAAILAGHGHIDATHAGEAVVDCLIEIRKNILKLDDVQKVVCVAIMNITSRKRSRIFIEPGASAGDIRGYFQKRNEIVPPQLDKILGELSQGETKVLDAMSYNGHGPFYQVRF